MKVTIIASTSQPPFKIPQISFNRDHKALDGGTFGMLEVACPLAASLRWNRMVLTDQSAVSGCTQYSMIACHSTLAYTLWQHDEVYTKHDMGLYLSR